MSVCRECSDRAYKAAFVMVKSEHEEIAARRAMEEEFWRRLEGTITTRVTRTLSRSYALAAGGLDEGGQLNEWFIGQAMAVSENLGTYAQENLGMIRSVSESLSTQILVQRFPDSKSRLGGAVLELRRANELLSRTERMVRPDNAGVAVGVPSIRAVFDKHHGKN